MREVIEICKNRGIEVTLKGFFEKETNTTAFDWELIEKKVNGERNGNTNN